MTDLSLLKASARKSAEAARNSCSKDRTGAARVVAAHALRELGRIPPSCWVAGYLPIKSEMDAKPLMLALHGLGCNICVPVVQGAEKPLLFRQWRPDSVLERGSFGVKVPATGDWVEPQVLIVPLLAFDPHCHRLGYGGGYYDRTIAGLGQTSSIRSVGLAWSGQLVNQIPRDEMDMQLDAVVTETGVFYPTA